MKFYNSNNRKGFHIDGNMDVNENGFNKNLGKWQMATGPSGTFLQSFDFQQNIDLNSVKEDIMNNWYFDMATPISDNGGNENTPIFPLQPNGFHLCSKLLNNQVNFKIAKTFSLCFFLTKGLLCH